MAQLKVTSHVSRDLLQSAEVFKRDTQVVWEYVSNSVQYHESGIAPVVVVSIDARNKTITIADNGRGMSVEGLAHFFTMHGENLERKHGQIGRGKFGTGKSAAFGIASTLRVVSVKDGLRNAVELEREKVEAVESGDEVPLTVLEHDVVTDEPDGTRVEVGRVHLKKIDREAIIHYIEQRLVQYPRDVSVIVDAHECTFRDPEVAFEYAVTADPGIFDEIAPAELVVKVAKAPLDQEANGIQVFSHGNWLATTLAGSERKEMAEYIFGEISVPKLEEYQGPVPPFDNTRSGELNPSNELVKALYRFIGPEIEKARRDLVARQRERARSQEARELAGQAEKIAELLNEDFASFTEQLRRTRAAVAGRDPGSKRYAPIADDGDEGAWIEGGDALASTLPGSRDAGDGEGGSGTPPPDMPRPVEEDAQGTTTGRPRGGDGTKRAPRGGMSVDYDTLGYEEHRAKYVPDGQIILINLDHPEVHAAFERGGRKTSDESFVRLSWDVAIAEYAVALARMRDNVGHYVEVEEPLFDIRDAIDRLSRRVWGTRS
jgi:hypothetical protein